MCIGVVKFEWIRVRFYVQLLRVGKPHHARKRDKEELIQLTNMCPGGSTQLFDPPNVALAKPSAHCAHILQQLRPYPWASLAVGFTHDGGVGTSADGDDILLKIQSLRIFFKRHSNLFSRSYGIVLYESRRYAVDLNHIPRTSDSFVKRLGYNTQVPGGLLRASIVSTLTGWPCAETNPRT